MVAVTEGVVRLLDRRELRGVIAHELAHIKNRDILISSIATAGASIISYVAHALSVGALVAPLAATLVQLGISRSREYLADAAGAEGSWP